MKEIKIGEFTYIMNKRGKLKLVKGDKNARRASNKKNKSSMARSIKI